MEGCLRKCWQSKCLFSSLHSFRRSSMSIHSVRNSVKRAYDGLLLDAAGTLLQLSKPVEDTYASIGAKYGLKLNSTEIKQGFKRAFAAPWPDKLRYEGDGRPFWKLVVSEATGCSDDRYFEEVYEHYGNGYAWCLPDGASKTIFILKNAGGHIQQMFFFFFFRLLLMIGRNKCFTHQFTSHVVSDGTVKVAVVSNFDTRLRKVLKELNVIDLFDAVIVSSEVGYEKPDARIFKAALDQIDMEADKVVHVGDNLKEDKVGANAVGIDCWLWGEDVETFADIQKSVLISGS